MGIKITTIPIMTSETVPALIRGGLVMSFQLWVAFGIFMYVCRQRYSKDNTDAPISGFCSNLIFYRIGHLAWRFQLAAAFAPAIPILILIWMCPGVFPSPYLPANPANSRNQRIPSLAAKKASVSRLFQLLLPVAKQRTTGG